jgi:hypothetical protein
MPYQPLLGSTNIKLVNMNLRMEFLVHTNDNGSEMHGKKFEVSKSMWCIGTRFISGASTTFTTDVGAQGYIAWKVL